MGFLAKKVVWIALLGVGLLLPAFSENGVKNKTQVQVKTEAMDRGCLVGKRGIAVVSDVVVQKNTWGIYGGLDVFCPLQAKDVFSDRWKLSGGFLKKLTEHFTWDLGVRYTFLQRLGFERVGHWTEIYTGIRSDLLMHPRIYFYWDQERRQKCFELKFGHDFDLSVFDWNQLTLSWENTLGFLTARRPYAQLEGGRLNRRHRYWYVETAFLLKRHLRENFSLYAGPVLTYNTGGIQSWTIANAATHRSHFCSIVFGCEVSF